jgi:hypothetical protein
MFEIFDEYWWLLFPLVFFVIMPAWGSFMRYKRTKAKIDLLKTYAASGKEPPAGLIESLDTDSSRPDWSETEGESSHGGGGGSMFLVVLFAGLAAVFAYVGYSGLIGIGETGYFIAMIMSVLALAFLANGMSKSGRKND